jgi:hypothetical protein
MALGCSVIGLILIARCHDFIRMDTGRFAGLLLGILLLFIGALALLLGGNRTIIVDPRARRIVIEDTNRFRKKHRSIVFGDIIDTHIGFLGKFPTHIYYLVLKLRSGEQFSLFPPGYFFDGGSDKSSMERRKLRLEEYLNSKDNIHR